MEEEEDASVFSAFTNQSTRAPDNPNVTNAVYAIGQITTLKEYEPILLALEERMKPMMDAEVDQYGWTKSSNYKKPCRRCNKTTTGLFNFIFFKFSFIINHSESSAIVSLHSFEGRKCCDTCFGQNHRLKCKVDRKKLGLWEEVEFEAEGTEEA